MYSDPALIRKHRVNLSLNEREHALVHAVCDFTGEEPAAFIRGLVLERALEVMSHASQSAGGGMEMRDTPMRQFSA